MPTEMRQEQPGSLKRLSSLPSLQKRFPQGKPVGFWNYERGGIKRKLING
jgi:hypothetical protein